jgi:hypothetical protein
LNDELVKRFANAISWASLIVTALFFVALGIQGISIVYGVTTYFSLFVGLFAAAAMLAGFALVRRSRQIEVSMKPEGVSVRIEGPVASTLVGAVEPVPITESGIIELTTRRLSSSGFEVEHLPVARRGRKMFDLVATKGRLTLVIEAKARKVVSHDVIAMEQMTSAAEGKKVVPMLVCTGFTRSAEESGRKSGVILRSVEELLRDSSLDIEHVRTY